MLEVRVQKFTTDGTFVKEWNINQLEYLFYWLMNFFYRVGQRTVVDFIISNNHPFPK